jgi:hypothetical protein
MKMTFEKTWHFGGKPSGVCRRYFTVGLSLNDWGLPLHVEAVKPYTAVDPHHDDERWVTQVIITVLCFYVGVEW